MSLISDFQRELLNSIMGVECERLNLVRKHDKNLSTLGEFSFPCLSNTKVWGEEKDINKVRNTALKSLSLDRIEEQKEICVVFLNREYALGKLFGDAKDPDVECCDAPTNAIVESNDASTNTDSVNIDDLDLTSARAVFVSDIIGRCMKKVGGKYPVSNKNFMKVGPVLEAGSRKKTKLSLAQFKNEVQETIESLDQQRREPGETAEDAKCRLMNLVNAQVVFDLVSSAPAAQCSLQKGSSTAAFVLYNSARISQILISFQHSVEQGVYLPLPPVFDYTLLKEEEEWEICFVYLLPYPDLLLEVVQQHTVHRISIHLIGLSKCLSRYYSRVKVLKDPLPQLIPIIHSRIQFLQEIQKVFQSSLHILGLQHLEKM